MTKAEQLVRQEEWRQKIAAYQASGQSVTQWCVTQGVGKSMFYYWPKKLQQQSEGISSTSTPEWLPVMLSDQQLGHLLIRLGKAIIEIQSGFNANLLIEVARALTTVC